MDYVLYDPTFARVFYFTILMGAGILAWRSHHHPTQRLWMLMFIGWVVYNALYALLGPAKLALFVASCDALICIACGHVAIKYKLNAAWTVVSLYVISCGFILGAWLMHAAGGFWFYIALNLLFVTRMVTVGADASARMVRWSDPKRARVVHLLVGG